jgi:hypothetical protein
MLSNSDVTGGSISDRPLLVHHVARLCELSERMVRYAAAHGQLCGFHDPGTPKIWRFLRQDVEDFRQRRRNRSWRRTR